MAPENYVIVGLGNPGDKYVNTRHNIGFSVVDNLAETAGTSMGTQKWDGWYGKAMCWGATLHLIKPMTYMNLSGKCVSRFMDFYKVSSQNLMVIHDDLDMKTARLKLVRGGGTGGHNGIRSIVSSIGENDFFRLKIGIGRPGSGQTHEKMGVEKYVLTPFHQDEMDQISERVEAILNGIRLFVEADAMKAMNYLNSFK